MQNESVFLIKKLIKKLNVTSNKELAEVLGISPAAISRWKKYNYVNAIKNKCHELGIYNEIFDKFDDQSTQYNNFSKAKFKDQAIGIDNTKEKIIDSSESSLQISNIPDFVLEDLLEDLEILFKRCKGKSEEKKELIDAIDNLIFDFRKKCR